jgi:CBS domain containing-hemolysin-like protein
MDPLLAGTALVPQLPQSTITVVGTATFVALMAVSAFFSSSEIAMFSLAKHRIDALVAEEARGARRVQRLRRNPHRMLVTILVGNNVANIAMSSIATGLLAFYVSPSESVVIATFGVTSLVLLFSESAPKSYAVVNAESWALRVAGPLEATQRLLYPIVAVFDYLTRQINRVTGGQTAIETAYVTRSELRELIEAGEQQGVLAETEGEIIQRTFQLGSTIAREVMIPRGDVAAVSTADGLDEAIEVCLASGHARLPVYDADFETVVGVVNLVDLVRDRYYGIEGGEGEDGGAGEDEDGGGRLLDLVQPTILVPDTKPVDELLAAMQRDRLEVAMTVDEFGSVDGLVTVEDILEALVGALLGPTEEPPIELADRSVALVRGDVTVEEVNEALGTEFPTDEPYETVAGLLLERTGRLLEEGERVTAYGATMSPTRVENGRILRVRVEFAADESPHPERSG